VTDDPRDATPVDPVDPVDPYDSSAGPHPYLEPEVYPTPPQDLPRNLPATLAESQPWHPVSPNPTTPYPTTPYPTTPYPTTTPYPATPYPATPYPAPPPAGVHPPPGYAAMPPMIVVQQPYHAPFGVDPVTGRPLSDKSKVVAGLLQLLPGAVLLLGGIGRLYAGNVALGVFQLVGTLVAWATFVCGMFTIVGWCLTVPFWLWFVIDGIVLLAGRPVDGSGRPLRS
jgi:TM2 domain-containing membrane protein YozV